MLLCELNRLHNFLTQTVHPFDRGHLINIVFSNEGLCARRVLSLNILGASLAETPIGVRVMRPPRVISALLGAE
jgi:hypothetical protein